MTSKINIRGLEMYSNITRDCKGHTVSIRPAIMLIAALLLLSFFYLGSANYSYAADSASRNNVAEAAVNNDTQTAVNNDTQTTVNVGYFSNGDFMHKTSSGNYEGYDIAYYYTLAGYANWKLNFVEFDSLDAALAGLKEGKIDILSGMSKTPERTSSYIFSSIKMCSALIAVQVREDNDKYDTGDTATMKDMTCGILAGSNVVTLYTDWCKDNGLKPHVVEYTTLDERNNALLKGKVDSIAGGSTIEGAQKIAEFPSLDLFFMLNSSRTDLKKQLDRAMSILLLQNPGFTTDLHDEYFPQTRNSRPSFSKNEKKYIRQHKVVDVAVLKDDAPFSRLNSDGTIDGILSEYYNHLSRRTGIKFKLVAYDSKDSACEALTAGRVGMIGKFENDIYDANRRDVMLSIAYLNMNLVGITHTGQQDITNIAVPECNAASVKRILENAGSSTKCITFKNSAECFAALKNNNVDGIVCTQTAATWLLNQNRASDYVVTAFGNNEKYDICCALKPGTDSNTLRSIVDKTISVDKGFAGQIATNYIVASAAGFSSFFNRISFSTLLLLAVIIGLLLIIAVIALVIIIRRHRIEHDIAEQKAELSAAEKINSSRREFFGNVSHDMRTPLNGILGFTNMALKSDDTVLIKDCLSKIKTSSDILSNMVNDTLIMSRVENGSYKLDVKPDDLRNVIDEMMAPQMMIAEDKGIDMTADISVDADCNVMVDRLSLQKVYMNIISNAVKFTPQGGRIRVDIKAAKASDNTIELWARVEDSGEGIASEFIPHIFEPFTQEDSANAGRHGNGLGLSIVKSIIDAMGGTIKVDSMKGRGTTFVVDLSLNKAGDLPVKDEPPVTDTAVLKGKRALVCEDNELNLEIMENILRNSGMEVDGFENGRLGLDAFIASAENYYDIVLLDVRMPVMDGNAAAAEIRKLDRADVSRVPIVAVSAEAYEENINASLESGMNAHIAKPIDPDNLIAAIASLLS